MDATQQFIEKYYQQFQQNPGSVDPQWQQYFHQMEQLGLTPGKTTQTVPEQKPGTDADPGSNSQEGPQAQANTLNREENAQESTLPAQDVTRSDLPPAPRAKVEPPTSPYASSRTRGATPDHGHENTADRVEKLKGIKGAIVKNMDASLSVPTATSARTVPAKVLIENRILINSHLARTRGGKVSFTHLIGYALVEALAQTPEMNVHYRIEDGKPVMDHLARVGFGLAIDVKQKNGERTLMVPVIKDADTLTFTEFVDAYEGLVDKARTGQLAATDFAGGTVTLTNPGTLGTVFSVPRLMSGQGLIIGVGATDYPAEWAGASEEQLARAGVGKVMNVTSTYDHRVIQGAGSGAFLGLLAKKLQGTDGFYERVFAALRVPIEPVKWERNEEHAGSSKVPKAARIASLVHAYRSRGHLAADTDPLEYRVRRHPDLSLSSYGLSMWDLDREFPVELAGEETKLTLRGLLAQLRDTYTRTMGIEYMHIQDPSQRLWMQREIETPYEKPTKEQRQQILTKLNQAEAFEHFLQTKYVGQKRFSLEGGESLIPLLHHILDCAAHDGLYGVAIGMAHRGRLNVLSNVAGKSNAQIFSEFEGNIDPLFERGSGDVKYHLGTEGTFEAPDGAQTNVYLAANPSHLEAVNPVVEGVVRAKLDKIGHAGDYGVLPLLVHGDAAFIGQGVVFETLNMSQLEAYRTGGTIHVIVNNQIGFTTSPTAGRSTNYCTDLAKGLQVPIFHVNADDPEMVMHAADLAYRFREKFNKDVIIDLVCYRRRGHNEGDDPSMTQPVMYASIDALPSTRTVYVQNLIGRGDLTAEEAAAALEAYHKELEKILEETRQRGGAPSEEHAGEEHGTNKPGTDKPGTGERAWQLPESQQEGSGLMIGWTSATTLDVLERIGDAHVALPEGFTVHPKLQKLLEKRQKMSREGDVDWGFAEILAFGSLLMEGTPIRMSGEDSRRATFVQRHAVLHDKVNGQEWTPLNFLTPDQAHIDIYDSSLSEFAPLGFEYGYSVERPEALTLWEAQFGDFAPGGQTIIDEFISSSEQKWSQTSSLVMLLPHGYEGQGPDHSSGRIERYLQLCAQDNMYVCQPSTPANYFHMLREQTYRQPRKPLIVFTPKQLLRLRAATSPLEEFTGGHFCPVLPDPRYVSAEGGAGADGAGGADQVQRVLLCSGRIYYDLAAERDRLEKESGKRLPVAIIRLEQLYPFHNGLTEALAPFPQDAELVWVGDEPANQGPWPFVCLNREQFVGQRPIRAVTREAAAAPSTGLPAIHKAQNRQLMEKAFKL